MAFKQEDSALIGSIFDYSFFSVACVSDSSLGLIQRIQNRVIRCIYGLDWDSPTSEIFPTSGEKNLKEIIINKKQIKYK